MLSSFVLTEQYALGGQYSWRLKDAEIRYRGSGQFAELVNRRIPASIDQIAAFSDALELLEVWSWRSDYDPTDIGWATLDGSVWSFTACSENRECKCAGENGYPAFADVSLTTCDRGRFGLLLTAMYDCFGLEAFVHMAERQRLHKQEHDE